MIYVADLPHGLGRRADPRRPAQPALPPPAAALARLLQRNRAGVIISRLTNDVEALDQLVTDGVTSLDPEHAHARRHRGAPLRARLAARARDAAGHPAAGRRDGALPQALGARLPRRARDASALVTATLAEDISGMRVLQAFTRERAASRELPAGRRSATALRNMQTVVQNGALLPVRRPALVGRDSPSCSATAATSYFDGQTTIGIAGRLHRLRDELLRPGAAALAALQHVPVGHGGAGQDHRGARRGAAR